MRVSNLKADIQSLLRPRATTCSQKPDGLTDRIQMLTKTFVDRDRTVGIKGDKKRGIGPNHIGVFETLFAGRPARTRAGLHAQARGLGVDRRSETLRHASSIVQTSDNSFCLFRNLDLLKGHLHPAETAIRRMTRDREAPCGLTWHQEHLNRLDLLEDAPISGLCWR